MTTKYILLLLLCFSHFAYAQTVYKCTDKLGNPVFTTDPCGKDAKTIVYGNQKKNLGDVPQESAQDQVKQRQKTAIEEISDSVEDSNCRRSAQQLFVVPSTARIEHANQQIYALQSRVYVNGYGRANEGQAAIANQQVEQEVLTLRQLISSEETRNDSIIADSNKHLTDALAECDKKKHQRETPPS